MDKSPDAFRTISEAAEELDLPQHVLRFWETRFTNIRPLKRGGGRRYYRPDDVMLLKGIRHLLYDQGFTIKGVQRILKDQGVRHVISLGTGTPIEDLPEELDAPQPGSGDFEPEVPFDTAEDMAHGGFPHLTAPPVVAEPKPRVLDEADREKLSNVLRELLECKRMLERARET